MNGLISHSNKVGTIGWWLLPPLLPHREPVKPCRTRVLLQLPLLLLHFPSKASKKNYHDRDLA